MTTITSISEARAAYFANVGYDETGSLTQAKAFRVACRAILATPSESEGPGDGGRVAFNLEVIQAQLAAVDAWIAANDTTSYEGFGTVKHVDFTGLRD